MGVVDLVMVKDSNDVMERGMDSCLLLELNARHALAGLFYIARALAYI